MPQPKKGESRGDFIQRYMRSTEAQGTFPKKTQRYAVAESEYDSKRRERERKP